MKITRVLVILSCLVSTTHGVEYLSSQYVRLLVQRYPGMKQQITALVNDLNENWTKYKAVEDQINKFQGTTLQEAHNLNARIASYQTAIKDQSAQLADLLCQAQKEELRDQITESAEFVILKRN